MSENPESLRLRMVEHQIRARGIKDRLVLGAMSRVPRHLFVPSESLDSAYSDRPLPIGHGQTISQPYMVAVMTEALELQGGERVLEVGTGSGYQSAVLAEIAGNVVTTERVPELAEEARRKLRELGYANIEVILTDGSAGFPEMAPYDGIIVTAGAPEIPHVMVDQLADCGRLVIPVGNSYQQTLTRLRRYGKEQVTERLEGCVFVPLIGEYGWAEHDEGDRR
jgi:protein-L-isoaspartate(D-aspartate) O-methyltransferase